MKTIILNSFWKMEVLDMMLLRNAPITEKQNQICSVSLIALSKV